MEDGSASPTSLAAGTGQPFIVSVDDLMDNTRGATKHLERSCRRLGITAATGTAAERGETRARLAMRLLGVDREPGADDVLHQLSVAMKMAWRSRAAMESWASDKFGDGWRNTWRATETVARVIERLFEQQGEFVSLTGEPLLVASLGAYPTFHVKGCLDRLMSHDELKKADKQQCVEYGLVWSPTDYALPALLSYGLFPNDRLFELYRARLAATIEQASAEQTRKKGLLRGLAIGAHEVDGHGMVLQPFAIQVAGHRVPCHLDILVSYWLGQGIAHARFEGRRRAGAAVLQAAAPVGGPEDVTAC
ncbi:hypothetical protein KVR01_003903 [Diaporthe batatas]|uniref:uncharacterized protein n=1 Tax=Diaporthe batatas TaxID=748121 RepID=UPI001D051DAD|nr:uncharacterized protein KVR01_003903 [Diaporthe batatas]KAG8168214.1 hypothetical protein KVR01_003903 [Diaporthe batatas]